MTCRAPYAIVAALLLAAAGGCATVDTMTPERYERGLVVVLGGAGGITPAPASIRSGLVDGGVEDAIEIFEWSAGHNVLEDQTDLKRNREVAGDLANRVLAYMAKYPGRPVHLFGLSAGTGIVIFAVERLPRSRPVDGVCLMASSLASTYDLTPALERVRNEITNFTSIADVFILGAGVAVAGTVDRSGGTSAGILGFEVPKDADEHTRELYEEKLVQVPWNPTDVIFGHAGTHLGASSSGYVKHFMAPIVRDAARRRMQGATPRAGGKADSAE